MIKVYDMASGNVVTQSQTDDYTDEVLYSEYQPIVEDFVEARLQVVETTQTETDKNAFTADLADIDCESFISSQK